MIGGTDIGEGAGPGSAFVANAAVFEVGRCQSFGGESRAEVACVVEIVFGAPISPVDVDDKGITWLAFFFGGRQTQIEKLVCVGTVGEARVGRRRLQSEDIVRHGEELILMGSGRTGSLMRAARRRRQKRRHACSLVTQGFDWV